jgi:hypothetical protein
MNWGLRGGVISYYLDCTGISIGGDKQTLRNKKDNDSTYLNEKSVTIRFYPEATERRAREIFSKIFSFSNKESLVYS